MSLHVTATRIQAKYKGYSVKGDYMRQREAGLYFDFLRTSII